MKWALIIFTLLGPNQIHVIDVVDYDNEEECQKSAHRIVKSTTPFYATCLLAPLRASPLPEVEL